MQEWTEQLQFSKDTEELNNTINEQDLIRTYTTFHPRTAKYIYFQEPTENIQDKSYLGLKKLNKFKITEIRLSMFSDYNEIKLKIIRISPKHLETKQLL